MLAIGYATKQGAASPSQVMTIGIGLKDPNARDEAALARTQQTPASPDYQHFLTPAQFDSRFAVSKAAFSRTLSWLRNGGANVVETSGARDYIEVTATVKQVDSLFGTRVNRYTAKRVTFLANATPPSKDLAIFESEHNLPKVPVQVTDIPRDGDFSDTGGNVEWELDTQSSTGVAPDVNKVHLYFAEHLIDPDVEADFVKWIDDPTGAQAGQRVVRRMRDHAGQRDAREHDPAAVQQRPRPERPLRHRRAGRARAGRRADPRAGSARGDGRTTPVR